MDQANALTPNSILVLFIVSVLAGAWAIYTLFTYHRSRRNAFFVAFIDLCFVGAFIAGVYYLRGINNQSCGSITSSNSSTTVSGVLGTITYTGIDVNLNKTCSMLKASWVFGIMNCIMFFFTSVLALLHGSTDRRDRRVREEEVVYVRESHGSRHGHRRSGSHRSRHSSHSGRRSAYV